MSTILAKDDPLLIVAGLTTLMVAGWLGGYWWGRREVLPGGETQETKAVDASLALLGLLLAFTFSMSLAKHDQRRSMVLAESNAIGDFYTCATLLKDPTRGKLQDEIRGYVRQKIDTLHKPPFGAELEQALERMQQAQTRMTAGVNQAINDGTPIVVPLTNTLNALTSNHAARVFAYQDRLPWSIVVLLFLAAILSFTMLGQQQGELHRPHRIATLSFIILIAFVVYVTLDLNQPGHGLIRVDQSSMLRLQEAIGS